MLNLAWKPFVEVYPLKNCRKTINTNCFPFCSIAIFNSLSKIFTQNQLQKHSHSQTYGSRLIPKGISFMPRVSISTRRFSILLALLLLLGGHSKAQITAPPEQLIPKPAAASPPMAPDSPENTKKSSTEPEANFDHFFQQYIQKLQRKIRQNWSPPEPTQSYETKVAFKIHRDGTMSDLMLTTISHNDASTQACLKRFEPVPPLINYPMLSPRKTLMSNSLLI